MAIQKLTPNMTVMIEKDDQIQEGVPLSGIEVVHSGWKGGHQILVNRGPDSSFIFKIYVTGSRGSYSA